MAMSGCTGARAVIVTSSELGPHLVDRVMSFVQDTLLVSTLYRRVLPAFLDSRSTKFALASLVRLRAKSHAQKV